MLLATQTCDTSTVMSRRTTARKRRPKESKIKLEGLIREAKAVIPHLLSGDFVTSSTMHGWTLAIAGISLSAEVVAILSRADKRLPRKLRAAIPMGRLMPENDGLPGIGDSQSWRWRCGAAN